MNLKVYRKTRYQNIYQHIKNKNYVVQMSKPVKTTISRIKNEKIWKVEDAIKIRDNEKIRFQRSVEIKYKNKFDDLWNEYIYWCKYDKKHAYNTIKRKENAYNRFFKDKFDKALSKYDRQYFINFIDNLDTTDIMKNHIIKYLKTFLNWCVDIKKCLIVNPLNRLPKYKVPESEMKYWLPDELKTFLNTVEYDIINGNSETKKKAYITKMLTLITFALGDRIGETRALLFENIDTNLCRIRIKHSINYDTKDKNFLVPTKTPESDEFVYTTKKVIDEILKYKEYLITELGYNIKDSTPIFINEFTHKPYSDSWLRNLFKIYIQKAGVSKIRMYDLRHTAATTLMSEGYDMYIIQNKLRHKSIKTTIDKYGHITLNKRKEIAEITDKYI